MGQGRIEDERIKNSREGDDDSEGDGYEEDWYEDEQFEVGYIELIKKLIIDGQNPDHLKERKMVKKIERNSGVAGQEEQETSEVTENYFVHAILTAMEQLLQQAEEARAESDEYLAGAAELQQLLVTIQQAISTGHIMKYYQDSDGGLGYSLKERGEMGFKKPAPKKKNN